MGTDRQIDRLLPRHEPEAGVTIDWNVREERQGLMKRGPASDAGRIVDLSLEGALVEVPATAAPCSIGDVVVLRLANVLGRAEVRHLEQIEEREAIRYGVRFLHDHVFIQLVGEMIGRLRDRQGQLAAAWQHAH